MTQKLQKIFLLKNDDKWYLPEYKVSLGHATLQRPLQ